MTVKINIDARGVSPQMAKHIQSYVDAVARGCATGEFSHPTRSRDELRLDHSQFENSERVEKLRADVQLWADRNGSLHVLCYEMLCALESLEADQDLIHGFRERLHNVPQCRRPDEPMRKGY